MFEIIYHDIPITENMQKCIDYIKNNEPEIAEYVNSLFLARKDEIQKQLLEYIAGQLDPIPPHFEWRYVGCPYDYSGALVEQGKISLNQSVEDFLENEYTGTKSTIFESHYGFSFDTYGDDLSSESLSIGFVIMIDGIKDYVESHTEISFQQFSQEEFLIIRTECNEFDPIYDECHASDFFWAASAVEFAGISSMTLKEVLDTQKI